MVGVAMEVNEQESPKGRSDSKINLTARVLFVIPTIDESRSLNGGDYGKFSSY
jgi:hypothetical protein